MPGLSCSLHFFRGPRAFFSIPGMQANQCGSVALHGGETKGALYFSCFPSRTSTNWLLASTDERREPGHLPRTHKSHRRIFIHRSYHHYIFHIVTSTRHYEWSSACVQGTQGRFRQGERLLWRKVGLLISAVTARLATPVGNPSMTSRYVR